MTHLLSMAQYKQAEITNVFWASNDGFKGGRDPLGIQNSSIATYSKLLPGLTNLTKHIRYYSLYCWLLSEYDRLEKLNEAHIHQYNFIRRAELAIALIMRHLNFGAVVGAMFVAQERYKIIEDGVYDLADGADYESKDKYWSFKSGALGQYYAGSLIYYELIKIEENRFYLRDKGKELACAVRNSIPESIRDTFIDCVLDGNITDVELKELEPIGIHNVEYATEEWKFLNNLLIQNDKDSSFRKETIFLLLNNLSSDIDVSDFVKYQFLYQHKLPDSEASFGWYFYYLCEGLHYSIDTLFCLILDKIRELYNPPYGLLKEDITESIVQLLQETKKYKTIDEYRSCISESIEEIYEALKISIKNQEYVKAACQAISLALKIYSEFESNKAEIIKFERTNELSRQRGILSEGLKSYVERYLNLPLTSYLEAIISQIMQEHTIVAIAKMGNSSSDLRKFIFEGGRAILVEQRYPVETSPRIDSLRNFLQDMGYITEDNKLTNIATKFIADYGKE